MISEEESVGSSPSVLPSFSTVNLFSDLESTPGDVKNSYFGAATYGGACFYCQKQGHIIKDCPRELNGYRKPELGSPPVTTNSRNLHIQCPCGAGTCLVRTSYTKRNPNRQFYSCPAKFEQNCRYFQWCDMVKKDEIDFFLQSEYPTCACGAGICCISTVKAGSYMGRKFFVCPVKKGQGACNFFKWMDETVINSDVSEVGSADSPQSTLGTQYDTSIAHSYSSKESNSSNLGNSSFRCPHEMDDESQAKALLIESPEHDSKLKIYSPEPNNQLGDGANENGSFLPKSSVTELVKPWAKFHGVGPCIEVTSSGHHALGWWGRLAFPPSRFLAEPPPRPFYCCVFPSFDPIFVHQAVGVIDVHGAIILLQSPLTSKSGDRLLLTADQDHQLSNGALWEPSDIRIPPNTVQGSSMTTPILEVFGQAAIRVQNELIALLESMDPLDHGGMMREASSAFAALDCLHIDCIRFKERVKKYIFCASLLAKIEQSKWDYVSFKELVDWCKCEKAQFDDLTRVHAEATAAVTAFKESLQLLSGEAFRLRNMLIQFENHLSYCEAETVGLENCLAQMSRDMLEPNQILQALSQEAAEALRKCLRFEKERITASAALERARLQLRQ